MISPPATALARDRRVAQGDYFSAEKAYRGMTPRVIVAVGASAGGLAAFSRLLDCLPSDSGAGFVLLQHLAADHSTILDQLLRPHSKMPLELATERVTVRANHVYIIPPGTRPTIRRGVLRLPATSSSEGLRLLDRFFISLAEDQGERAVCIILSGSGDDGSLGLRAVRQHGGLAIAQTDVGTGGFSAMPDHAADTGLLDAVLTIEQMPDFLSQYGAHIGPPLSRPREPSPDADLQTLLPHMLRVVKVGTGNDFSGYKTSMLLRRIRRRMAILRMSEPAQYLSRLTEGHSEAVTLRRDFLIGVTQFFRDREAFDALRQALPVVLATSSASKPFRMWVPACATGEEAYSLAILLRETMAELGIAARAQIFSTDIDEAAIGFARAGRYHSRMVAELPAEIRQRWFVEQDGVMEVAREIREMCIFASQNVIEDPPLSNMDLISCRNLMIYLDEHLQNQVLERFHFSLRAHGLLLLGASEGVGRSHALFRPVDQRYRLYRRVENLPGTQAASPRSGSMVRSDDDLAASFLGDTVQPHASTPTDRAISEELQAATEELEVSREEMQSVIEELQSLNVELNAKNDDLLKLNNNLKNFLESTHIPTLFLDRHKQVAAFTPNMATLFALRPCDVGRPIGELVSKVDYKTLEEDFCTVSDFHQVVEREVTSVGPQRRVFLLRIRPYRRVDNDIDGVVLTFVDITDRKLAEDRLDFLANHDQLTGLPNRGMFAAALHPVRRSLVQAHGRTVVLCLDLDGFKAVNDIHGHWVGDALLQLVAQRLLKCVRTGDLVCRLGGDEFVIVQRHASSEDETTALAERVLAALATPFEIEGRSIKIGVSIGIATSQSDPVDAEALLRGADMALYAAKAQGGGVSRTLEAEMLSELQIRNQMAADLSHAIERDEFALVFQPIIQIDDRAIICGEALLRWKHKRWGLVPPERFIPIAETNGLIVPIGNWVLYRACSEAARWAGDVRVSVNVSASQLVSPGLVEVVVDALAGARLAPGRLVLEVTETVLLRNTPDTQVTLSRLREVGVGISVDDFGIGYSSLSYLRSFRIDQIKVDQSYVKGAGSPGPSTVILKAVADIGDGLGIVVCAEGVTTEAQLAALRHLGIRQAQGFGLYKPMSADAFYALMLARAPRAESPA